MQSRLDAFGIRPDHIVLSGITDLNAFRGNIRLKCI